MSAETVFYWLIERGPAINHVPTVYYAEGPDRHWWTEDAYAAKWFDTKAEAETVIDDHQRINRPPWAVAVEHGFMQETP